MQFSKVFSLLHGITKDAIEREGPLNAMQKSGPLKVESWIVSDKRQIINLLQCHFKNKLKSSLKVIKVYQRSEDYIDKE